MPFIFLTAMAAKATIEATLDAGAAAFLIKPFPLALLKEKVVQTLARGSMAVPPAPAEEVRPHPGGRAPVQLLLDGQRPPAPPKPAPAPAPRNGELAQPTFGDLFAVLLGEEESRPKQVRAPLSGRFSTVDTDAGRILVLTEFSATPRFSITTVIAKDGRGLRKIEMSWSHPLQREGDAELIVKQVDAQHEHALVLTRDLRLEKPRSVILGDTRRSVDAALLAWAVTAVAGEAVAQDRARAVAALRTTWGVLSRRNKVLHMFRIQENGRVVENPPRVGRVSQAAVRAVAAWIAAFLGESGPAVSGSLRSRVQRVMKDRSHELERAGLYAALDAVKPAARTERPAAVPAGVGRSGSSPR